MDQLFKEINWSHLRILQILSSLLASVPGHCQGSKSVKAQETVTSCQHTGLGESSGQAQARVRVGDLSSAHVVEGEKEPTAPQVFFGSSHGRCAYGQPLHTPHGSMPDVARCLRGA